MVVLENFAVTPFGSTESDRAQKEFESFSDHYENPWVPVFSAKFRYLCKDILQCTVIILMFIFTA